MKRILFAITLIAACLCSAFALSACDTGSTAHTHSYKLIATTEPTCTVSGKNIYKCSCGEGYETVAQAAKGHTFGSGRHIEATCAASGGMQYKCNVCSYSYIDPETIIPALDHTYNFSRTVEARCKEQGYDLYICSLCGKTKQANFTPELGHAIVPDVGYAATCQKTGLTDGSHCERCLTKLKPQLIIPILDHADNDYDSYCDECSVFVREIKNINSVSDLKQIVNDLDGTYVLRTDLVLDDPWAGIGTLKEAFTGTFYGNGHKIKNLTVNCVSNAPMGLFVVNRGVIADVTLENMSLSAWYGTYTPYIRFIYGGLTGYNYGTIRNCKIMGYNSFRCTNNWQLTEESETDFHFTLGGLTAYNYGTIDDCSAVGTVDAAVSTKCNYAMNNFLETDSDWARTTSTVTFGIIAGYNAGTITDSTADCVQNIELNAIAQLTREHCGKAFAVINSYIGGFVGNNSATIMDCKARACTFNAQKSAETDDGCAADITIRNESRYSGLIGYDKGSIDRLDILV